MISNVRNEVHCVCMIKVWYSRCQIRCWYVSMLTKCSVTYLHGMCLTNMYLSRVFWHHRHCWRCSFLRDDINQQHCAILGRLKLFNGWNCMCQKTIFIYQVICWCRFTR